LQKILEIHSPPRENGRLGGVGGLGAAVNKGGLSFLEQLKARKKPSDLESANGSSMLNENMVGTTDGSRCKSAVPLKPDCGLSFLDQIKEKRKVLE